MTPAQIAALTAIAGLLEKMGNWKVGSLIAAIAFLPDIIFVVIIIFIQNRQDKAITTHAQQLQTAIAEQKAQTQSFELKYDNNVELVKQITKIADNLQDIVVLNTQTLQGVQDRVDNNLFCPLMRKDPKVEKHV